MQPTQASSGSQKQGGAELRLLQPAKFEVMINEKTLSGIISLKIGYKVKIYCGFLVKTFLHLLKIKICHDVLKLCNPEFSGFELEDSSLPPIQNNITRSTQQIQSMIIVLVLIPGPFIMC